jgi:hypothetical protein
MRYFGICLGHVGEGQAEGWLHGFGVPAAVEVCTSRSSGPDVRVALSFAVPRGTALQLPPPRPEFADAAMRAAAAHAAGSAGRAVYFRGSGNLCGTMTAEAVMSSTTIQSVLVDNDPVTSRSLVGPLEDARPVWRDGLLTLLVTATIEGVHLPRL